VTSITVLGGGNSTEREISLKSARSVELALKKSGYVVTSIDITEFSSVDRIDPMSIVFPILHGANGEDGKIQLLLEKGGYAFLGSDSKSSRNCFNKTITKSILKKGGIPVAEGDEVTKDEYWMHYLRHKPHVLKTDEGGSSIGTYIVANPAKVDKEKVDVVYRFGQKAIIEELIVGVEVTVPVLDFTALPVIEIVPPINEDFNYDNKYNGRTSEICPTTGISKLLQKNAQGIAEAVHKLMGCRHLSRVDMIIKPDGNIIVLEINTIPGMTNQSLYPLGAKVYGLDFQSLMTEFVNLVKRDYQLV
jgi:D-alanine-D-alanine ligase